MIHRLRVFFSGMNVGMMVQVAIFTVAISVFPVYALYIVHETNQRLIKFEAYALDRDARLEARLKDRDDRIREYVRQRDARWESYLSRPRESNK